MRTDFSEGLGEELVFCRVLLQQQLAGRHTDGTI